VPLGAFTYKVIGVAAGKTTFPAITFLSTFTPAGTLLRGDANRDDRVNLADAIFTLNFLYRGGPAPPCEDAADADDDGKISMEDPIVTLWYLFLGEDGIRPPGPTSPWFDPTPDALGCRS
jgi:hypothetical protein